MKKIARAVGVGIAILAIYWAMVIGGLHLKALNESKQLTRMACAQQGYFGGTAYGWYGMHQICYTAVDVSLDEVIIFEPEEVE